LGPVLRRLIRLAVAAAALGLLWRAVRLVGWGELWRLVRAADLRWTLAGVVLLVARYLVCTVRWRLALRHLGPLPSTLHSFLSVVGGICANNLTPTLPVGGLMRARLDGGGGDRTFGHVYGAVLFDQIAHHVVITLNGWLALLGVALWYGRPGLAAAGSAALVLAALAVSIWLRRLDEARVDRITEWLARRRSARGESRLRALHEHGRAALRVVQRLLQESGLRRGALLLGLGFVMLNTLAQWAFFLALDRPVDMLTVWVAVTIGVMTGYFTGTPGGVGTTEAGMVIALAAMGVPELDAAAGTLLYRGLHYATMMALGVPALVVLESRVRRRMGMVGETA
jgi:uncharacterized protein (TIRG00374 family)